MAPIPGWIATPDVNVHPTFAPAATMRASAAEARHAAFYAKLQDAHTRALALNAGRPSDDMEDDANDTATPGKDLMTAPRQ